MGRQPGLIKRARRVWRALTEPEQKCCDECGEWMDWIGTGTYIESGKKYEQGYWSCPRCGATC